MAPGLTVKAAREARTAGLGAGRPAGRAAAQGAPAPARPLDLASLDRLLERLPGASAPRRQPSEHRDRLLRLRAEIDRLLADLE